MRHVDGFARLELEGADFQNVAGALVQELDDAGVKLVNRLAKFRNFHRRQRYTTPAQKHVKIFAQTACPHDTQLTPRADRGTIQSCDAAMFHCQCSRNMA